MSKKELFSVKSFKNLKNLKLDETPTNFKSKKCLPSSEELFNKRKEKRLFKSIKVIPLNDDSTIQENFTPINKQQNSIDKNLLGKSLSSHFAFSSLVADKAIRDTLIEQFKFGRLGEG